MRSTAGITAISDDIIDQHGHHGFTLDRRGRRLDFDHPGCSGSNCRDEDGYIRPDI